MKSEILKLLREAEGYLSGQELCERFGVTRTAVWKAIKQLQNEGYEVEAVPNKGYSLKGQTDIFSKNELESRIQTKWAGRNLYFYDCIDSTNHQAKLLAEDGACHGSLITAVTQTAGRGRKGRSWESPPDKNIYFSLLLRPDFIPNCAPMLTLVMAHSVQKALALMEFTTQIKWPNDIVMNGKKITGILTEMSLQGEDIQYVVIGVGINVKKQPFDDELKRKATTIEDETGKEIPRAVLVQKIMEQFEKDYDLFQKTKDLSLFLEEYNDSLVNRNKEVLVLDLAGEYQGFALGINNKGELLVQLKDHTIKNVYAGEVSVRGIYGYV